jgi:flagellar motor switch protein FliG
MILNRLPREAQARLVSAIRASDPASAVRIEEILVQELRGAAPTTATSLSTIADMSDRDVQKLLRSVDSRDLVVTLSSASDQAKDKVLNNLSQSRQQQVIEEMHDLKTLTPSEVEAANARILKKMESLYPGQPSATPDTKRLRSRLA